MAFWHFLMLVAIGAQLVIGQDDALTYVCRQQRCFKIKRSELEPPETGLAIGVCKLNCGRHGSLLPLPTGTVTLGRTFVPFHPFEVSFNTPTDLADWFTILEGIFKDNIMQLHPDTDDNDNSTPHFNDTTNNVVVVFEVDSNDKSITLTTDESYSLSIVTVGPTVTATITAPTYFGARHGLETLSQLIAYDEYGNYLQILSSATIEDEPVFPYRGVMLDTSRNFFPISRLKKVIDGLSYSKLNIFHWHITDTHSFPMTVPQVPQMIQYGAYSSKKVYTVDDMKDLVAYAKVRGVKIMIELDAPAHSGNGWNWGPEFNLGNLSVCVNKDQWYDNCVEPPCGQLNPTNENMYTILGKIFEDMLAIFDNDLFHMGGDEVDMRCWNTTEEITDWMAAEDIKTDMDGFVHLWGIYQKRAHELLVKASTNKDIMSMMWASELAGKEYIQEHLNVSQYIIQLWFTTTDVNIPFLIDNKYKTIFSNHDALYLDCGFGNWIGEGNNWCSPYHGWEKVYENSPQKIYAATAGTAAAEEAVKTKLILGAEAPLWTEQVDDTAVEAKIWPRGSALAERLWTNPTTGWKDAETRMVNNRQRYVQRGLHPDRLQPEWCYQNEEKCYNYPVVVPDPVTTTTTTTTTTPSTTTAMSSHLYPQLTVFAFVLFISVLMI